MCRFIVTDKFCKVPKAAREQKTVMNRFPITVFEENGSGDYKIAGIKVYGQGIDIVEVVDIREALPEIIDEPEEYIPSEIKGALVLNFLRHPDLCEYLVKVCNRLSIPVIASNKHIPGAICPFTCCGLGRKKGLGTYGEQFGLPEYEVEVRDGKIAKMKVRRGASCGATWQVIQKIVGLAVDEALIAIGRESQYLCMADPSAFDPVSGKSMVHYAGELHHAALKRALDQAGNGTS